MPSPTASTTCAAIFPRWRSPGSSQGCPRCAMSAPLRATRARWGALAPRSPQAAGAAAASGRDAAAHTGGRGHAKQPVGQGAVAAMAPPGLGAAGAPSLLLSRGGGGGAGAAAGGGGGPAGRGGPGGGRGGGGRGPGRGGGGGGPPGPRPAGAQLGRRRGWWRAAPPPPPPSSQPGSAHRPPGLGTAGCVHQPGTGRAAVHGRAGGGCCHSKGGSTGRAGARAGAGRLRWHGRSGRVLRGVLPSPQVARRGPACTSATPAGSWGVTPTSGCAGCRRWQWWLPTAWAAPAPAWPTWRPCTQPPAAASRRRHAAPSYPWAAWRWGGHGTGEPGPVPCCGPGDGLAQAQLPGRTLQHPGRAGRRGRGRQPLSGRAQCACAAFAGRCCSSCWASRWACKPS